MSNQSSQCRVGASGQLFPHKKKHDAEGDPSTPRATVSATCRLPAWREYGSCKAEPCVPWRPNWCCGALREIMRERLRGARRQSTHQQARILPLPSLLPVPFYHQQINSKTGNIALQEFTKPTVWSRKEGNRRTHLAPLWDRGFQHRASTSATISRKNLVFILVHVEPA